jgi:hypothetical protein
MIRRYVHSNSAGRSNNGHLMLGSVDAAIHCRCHQSTAWRGMQEIRTSGLATITDLGRMIGEDHRASRWQLNFFKLFAAASATADTLPQKPKVARR